LKASGSLAACVISASSSKALSRLDGGINAAINQLAAFIKKVEKDISKGNISAEEGQDLINEANQIIAALS